MPTPFPGMDPYLERPNLWSNVHASLITALRDYLAPLLRPRYFISVEERSYLDDPFGVGVMSVPDVGVIGPFAPTPVMPTGGVATSVDPLEVQLKMIDYMRETYLEVVEAEPEVDTGLNGEEQERWVVTLIEVLPPWNKRPKDGRERYVAKRNEVIHSATNLVEIDLLRVGTSMIKLEKIQHDYSIFVSPMHLRSRAHFYPFSVRDPIPAFKLPLQADDEEPIVDMNQILHELYDRAGYDLRINYGAEPMPTFEGEDAKWIEKLLHEDRSR